jgi:hypothetical protein
LKFYQQLTGEERRIPFIFDDFHFCRSRVIGLDMTENRIFTLCRMITWVVFLRMFWNFISSLLVKRGGGGGYTVLPLLPSVQDIFRRIFLSNCWWQKSDIWSQASYRYPISWEVFFDPSDSYFLFAKERGYHRWALAHSSSRFSLLPFQSYWTWYDGKWEFYRCRMITWVVFFKMFWNFISSLPVKRGGSLSFLVRTIRNVLVMEIGWTDVGSGGYILVSCAHSNTS